MQGIKRLKEAVQKHRENKDINIKYKTPLTSKSLPSRHGNKQYHLPHCTCTVS